MPHNVTHKAVAISRFLADDLAKRFSDLQVDESFDSVGNPVITISDGTPAAGERVIILRTVGDENAEAKDILGNEAIHYTPHTVQLMTEENAGAGDTDIDDPLTSQDILNVIADVARRTPKIEWYQTATTVVPSVAAIIPGNLKAEFQNLYWNVQSQS